MSRKVGGHLYSAERGHNVFIQNNKRVWIMERVCFENISCNVPSVTDTKNRLGESTCLLLVINFLS